MDSVTLDTFRRNAFRVLGLTAQASQEQIDSAARLLRLTAGQSNPPTSNDALWLGPLSRELPAVEHAVMRLTDPESRIFERLWWYCDQPPGTDYPRSFALAADSATRARHAHDAAVTNLARLLILGPIKSSLEHWSALLGDCRAVAADPAYRQWLVDAERNGDFEKQARADEIAQLHAQFADALVAPLITLADKMVAQGVYDVPGKILDMLRATSSSACQEAEDRILNRSEDLLVGKCNDITDSVDLAWKTRQVKVLSPACNKAESVCASSLLPLVRSMQSWNIRDGDRVNRSRGQVARVYVHIADAHEACNNKWAAHQTLTQSLQAAQGTSYETRIRQRLETLKGSKPGVFSQTTRRPQASGGKSIGRWPLWIIGIILVNLIRLCATNATSLSSSNSDIDPIPTPLFSYQSSNTQPSMPGLTNDPEFQAAYERYIEGQKAKNPAISSTQSINQGLPPLVKAPKTSITPFQDPEPAERVGSNIPGVPDQSQSFGMQPVLPTYSSPPSPALPPRTR